MFGLGMLAEAAADPVDFAQQVAPLLTARCLRCHQPANRQGELSLATPDDLDSLGYLVPGQSADSHLVAVIAPQGDDRPQMPKEGVPLTADERALIARWIDEGAPWPEGLVLAERARADRSWWSLAPLGDGPPPEPVGLPPAWAANPIDRWVFAGLAGAGLAPNPPAARQTLVRRVTFDLTGLPPTPEEIDEFVRDKADDDTAYARLVERLLASPRYGEQWGRHWLDVVRFGESNGFERNVAINNLWPFRDYVIRSFNDDKPFDQLIHEHLAGDQLAPGDPAFEIGAAFLVAGPYDNVGNSDPAQAAIIRANTLDEMIRTTGEAFLGMTIGCARCHDHKFDPLLQADYYAWYATLAGVRHGEREIAREAERQARSAAAAPLERRRDELALAAAQLRQTIAQRASDRAAEHARAWTRPPVDRYLTEESFAPVVARHVKLVVESLDTSPEARAGYRLDEFEIWTAENAPRNVALASAGATAAGASRQAQDFQAAYDPGLVLDGEYGARWLAAGPELTVTLAQPALISRVSFSSDRRRGLGPTDANTVFVGDYQLMISENGTDWVTVAGSRDRQPVSESLRAWRLFQAEITAEERGRLAELDRQLAAARAELAAWPAFPVWWVGQFQAAPGPFAVFQGGDPARRGAEVAPHGWSVLADLASHYALPAEAPEAERRLALARWITAAENPLTPRVLANRLWHYHFGTGIVDTPSDFGYMGGRPSHPELLDWLARQVLAHEWRLKPLHRLIVMSQTYRQASTGRPEALARDADSRLLGRFPPRRLAAEEVRDAMLAVAGVLNETPGGPGFRLYRYLEDNVATYVPLDAPGPETYRRAVYHQNARAAVVDVLADFDCPDPAFAAPKRARTTTPLQALALLNHQFSRDLGRAWAERLEREAPGDVATQVSRAFRLALGRPPTARETASAAGLVAEYGLPALCRALYNANEFVYVD